MTEYFIAMISFGCIVGGSAYIAYTVAKSIHLLIMHYIDKRMLCKSMLRTADALNKFTAVMEKLNAEGKIQKISMPNKAVKAKKKK